MRRLLVLVPVLAAALSCGTPLQLSEMSWEQVPMDGHLTGVLCPSYGDWAGTIGTLEDRVYTSPNGNRYEGTVAAVAAEVLAVQPAMDEAVRQILGYASASMVSRGPESALSDMAVDQLAIAVEKALGVHVDIAIFNFGGIRTSLPQGDIQRGDIVSMFPFHNKAVLVSLKGSVLKETLRRVFGKYPQPVSRASIVMDGGTLESVLVEGQEIEDGRLYNLASVDFLVGPGDGMFLGRDAESVTYTDLDPQDIMIEYITSRSAAGEQISYPLDGRIVIR